ncbi:hypothetical protein N781_14055 [Pontibacillus halophilus JSM 076056 = DSM 19796]|uniref:Diguanylate cyclase n=1 Tax=Pontibacillus halophilus JSM 076056 = DSM 19796 TaxID=1385510 RepID=A0A0A5GIE9_9BACI|nr:bifunctional diguanylate cyclase/phosphodiesterase [Pontibacillus halophilus]KGX92991.1 hypothetical protein N781_14055 [Pontibacillus halophilus JSM 076056 = DSM 19796]
MDLLYSETYLLDQLYKRISDAVDQSRVLQGRQLDRGKLHKSLAAYMMKSGSVKNAPNSLSVMVLNDSGEIVQTNDVSGFLVASNHRKPKFEDVYELVYTGSYRANLQDVWNTMRMGETWTGLLKTHGEIWMQATVMPVMDVQSHVQGAIILCGRNQGFEGNPLFKDHVAHDFLRTVQALVNLVFKVERHPYTGEYHFTLFEGKLAGVLGMSTAIVNGKKLQDLFGKDKAAFLQRHYERAFEGEEVSYKERFYEKYLYTNLSPVIENGKVIEVIGSSVDITDHEEAELRVRYIAYHDPLTDLPNRRKLRENVDRSIELSRSNGRSFAVLFLDLNRFKYINDAFGHRYGDQVLVTIAERVLEILGYQDELYRFSGDEFVIVVNDAEDLDYVENLGNEVLKQIERPIMIREKEFFLTASMGVTIYPLGGFTCDQLISHADIAMQYCKLHKGQGVVIYSPNMNETYHDMVNLEGDLRRALQAHELELYYQPKVNVQTGEISGMEALIRWTHPQKGLLSPAKFIPVAEETGLIIQMGEWVIFEACRQNQEWLLEGYPPQRVAVNVSAIELQRHNFSKKVEQILENTGLPPEYLEIEITENSIMQNTEECMQTLKELREMGVKLSIDDFGTGYSSLGYLPRFPLNYLKIDQTFIQNLKCNQNNAEIVKAVIQLAHTFNLEVIAEGVEDEHVLQFLKEEGCEYYQGFYFSKPLSPEMFEHLLQQRNPQTL